MAQSFALSCSSSDFFFFLAYLFPGSLPLLVGVVFEGLEKEGKTYRMGGSWFESFSMEERIKAVGKFMHWELSDLFHRGQLPSPSLGSRRPSWGK